MENYAVYINLAGLAVILVGCLLFISRSLRNWKKGLFPLALIALGVMITAFPPAFHLLMPIDLGPRERIVDGERHITLTGWDQKDYGLLGSKTDTVVLQMANPDVTDQALAPLPRMTKLRELDLNNTGITDEGLKVLKDLPALSMLRLKNTKITDQGFQESLAGMESLTRLELSGTSVSEETIQTWSKAKPGRRALR